jgi:virginiamycin B lyase
MMNLLKSLCPSFHHRFRMVGKRPGLREFRHRLLLEPLELRCLPTSLSFTPFSIPTANAGPIRITVGADGNLWFTENDRIGRITPSGAITEFSIPSGSGPTGDITPGPDGNLWFTESSVGLTVPGAIGRISTAGVIMEFSLPKGASPDPKGITAGPDGNLWFGDGGSIGQITPNGTITQFNLSLDPSVEVGAVTTGPDGNLWIVTSCVIQTGPIIGKPTAALKVAPSGKVANTYSLAPAIRESITTGPDGNLWFTGMTLGGSLAPSDTIGRITTTGVVTYFNTPTFDGDVAIITAGPDGNLWFTEELAAKIGQITPSGVITEFAGPYSNPPIAGGPITEPTGIVTGPDDHLWYVDSGANQVIRINLNANPPPWLDRVYRDLLQRAPDSSGLAFFTGLLDQGTATRTQVAQAIENSQEYQTLEVSNLYQSVLRRAADPSGLNTWVNYLAQGGTAEQLRALLLGSDEYFSRFGGGSNSGYLAALYQDALQRSLDATGAAGWGGALDAGATPTDVAAAVLESLESDTNEAESLYQQFLHRAADPTGLQAFVNALQQGTTHEALIAFMIGSDEYFAGL